MAEQNQTSEEANLVRGLPMFTASDPEALAREKDAIYAEVDRVLELAAERKYVCIGTGALPYETDPDAVLKIREYILSKK